MCMYVCILYVRVVGEMEGFEGMAVVVQEIDDE